MKFNEIEFLFSKFCGVNEFARNVSARVLPDYWVIMVVGEHLLLEEIFIIKNYVLVWNNKEKLLNKFKFQIKYSRTEKI